MKRIITLLAAAALALAVSVPAVLAKGGDGTRIVLKPTKAFPAAKGSATFKAKPGERQLEVEHLRRLAGKRVTFFVGGTKLGTARIGVLGAAQIERRNSDVPTVNAGTAVSVKTAGRVLIVRGSF